MLHCREAVIDALRQRLYALGLNNQHSNVNLPADLSRVRISNFDERLASLIDRIAFEVPSMPLDERMPPSEVLTRAPGDHIVELWRLAAVELLAASHALDTAADRPWLRDHGAGWYVMRDVTVALEAFIVLDDRLEQVGLLTQHLRPPSTLSLEERRLVTSQAARMATWFATSNAADQAVPRRKQYPVDATWPRLPRS